MGKERMALRAELEERLAAQKRVRLAHLPTPLDPCPRFSQALGGAEVWIKRDDLTGLALGGNKTRQLEYVFADLLEAGCDTVVAGAYTQSNWCRQMTAAAKRLGLDISLVLVHGEKGPALQGNLLLDRLMGADVTVVDLESLEQLQPHLEAKAESLRAAGRRPYIVAPLGLENLALGAVGYVAAALELDAQLEAAGIEAADLYLCGANMTPAGLMLGLKHLGRDVRVHNVTPIKWVEPRKEGIARIANACAERLGLATRLTADEVDSTDSFIGPRYGLVTAEALEAMKLLAGTEGIIVDPVYTSKALAALVADARAGRLSGDRPVLFLHTGGTPALFAYAEDLELVA
ncbi:D-cysteine desulfhydrase family protein [Geminicoccaceae bacterium 1502E]|nr:D-cysteine desulfhydrase family protein [Geminicoccaceae bacterium 1502E]